ncbi:MAG: hypothetical protein IJW59_04735 [Clostridia bacterium]|nr:hypothetical protein [Clostridia bacterium]
MKQDNSIKKLDKAMDILNLILCLSLITSPLILSFVSLMLDDLTLAYMIIIFGTIYVNYLPIVFVPKLLKKNYRKKILKSMKSPPIIIMYVLIGWIVLSTIINNVINVYLAIYLIYILIFICTFTTQEKYKTIIINTLLITMAICCVMGFIDVRNEFLPGFFTLSFPQSLQFYNPNYTGYVMSMIAIYNCWLLSETDKTYQKVISSCVHICLTIHLFMNGSFAPITAYYLLLIVMIIYKWVTTKKCPFKLLIMFASVFATMFLVDLIPGIETFRNCPYNYFLECLAVVDNILGTKILPALTGIEEIAGADGWDRDALQKESLAAIFGSFKTFLFGGGAGNAYNYRPHNAILSTWLDFGIIAPICYIAINVYVVVRYFKAKSENKTNLFGLISAIIGYFFVLIFGSVIHFHFSFFVVILALAYRETNKLYKKKKIIIELEDDSLSDTETINESTKPDNNSESLDENKKEIKNTQNKKKKQTTSKENKKDAEPI